MNVFVASLGCSKNLVDSEYLLGALAQAGHSVVQAPDTAHLIIVNTCGFISSAVEEAIHTILELATLKKEGVCQQLIVFGCLVQRYGADLVTELPEVDFFTGVGAINEVMASLAKETKKFQPIFPAQVPLCTSAQPRASFVSPTAYIKISEGCDRHCTYCIIPKLRGPQRSRDMADILKEARQLVENGAQELVLVAQETTAWGNDLPPKNSFAVLLEKLATQEPDVWIRFLYGHPQSVTAKLIEVIQKYDPICSYFDIPIQHASNTVLKRMGRNETQADLRALFQNIRCHIPNAVLRTTVIVGFPGETQKEAKDLLGFIKEIQFDHLGAFLYSPEVDLPSFHLPNPVSVQTAKRRYARVMEIQQEIAAQKNQFYGEKTISVLLEEQIDPVTFAGRSQFQAPEVDGEILVTGEKMHVGDRISVQITETHPYDLEGIKV